VPVNIQACCNDLVSCQIADRGTAPSDIKLQSPWLSVMCEYASRWVRLDIHSTQCEGRDLLPRRRRCCSLHRARQPWIAAADASPSWRNRDSGRVVHTPVARSGGDPLGRFTSM
jgi:hypothetical protein